MGRFEQKIFKLDDRDPKAVTVRQQLCMIRCIQCGEKFAQHETIMFTKLSNGKLIWWHIRPSCIPDNPEEYEKN